MIIKKVKEKLFLIAIVLVVLLLYTFLHEGGHAIVGVLGGAKITQFSVNFFNLSAHVSFDGYDKISGIPLALIHIAGWYIPFAVWFIIMLLTKKTNNQRFEYAKFIASICIIGSTLPWVVLSFLYGMNIYVQDDVTKFLLTNNINGYASAAVFLIIVLLSFLFMLDRIEVEALKSFLGAKFQKGKWNYNSLLRPVIVIVCLVFFANAFLLYWQGSSSRQVVNTDLKTFETDRMLLHRFNIGSDNTEIKLTLINYKLQDFELKLKDDSTETILLAGKGLWGDSLIQSYRLSRGNYELLIRNKGGKGRLRVFQSEYGQTFFDSGESLQEVNKYK